jgi:Carbohydrate/starch-binding module (family 21)
MSTLIRNTTTLECGIDRRVGRAGHGEHGGWSLSQGTTIICSCGERLFELADLKAAEAAEGLSTFAMDANVLVGGYQAAGENLNVQVLVRNIAFQKQVAIVYTTDNWFTCRTAFGTYSPPFAPASAPHQPNTELWNIGPVAVGATGQFAAFYAVAGATYWDNNLGLNYSFGPRNGVRAMSTLIRNTTTLECGIDRRVGRAGHGEHGGWSLSQGTTIICLCGERLFELADLRAAA